MLLWISGLCNLMNEFIIFLRLVIFMLIMSFFDSWYLFEWKTEREKCKTFAVYSVKWMKFTANMKINHLFTLNKIVQLIEKLGNQPSTNWCWLFRSLGHSAMSLSSVNRNILVVTGFSGRMLGVITRIVTKYISNNLGQVKRFNRTWISHFVEGSVEASSSWAIEKYWLPRYEPFGNLLMVNSWSEKGGSHFQRIFSVRRCNWNITSG